MAAPKGRAKGWETRRQNEEFAAQNIPAGTEELWNKVKGQIKGTPHQRAERFKEYLESHPKELNAALQSNADSRVDELVAQRNASSPTGGSSSMSVVEDAGTPF